MSSSLQIEETAAEWLARRDSSTWDEVEARSFEDWVNASTAHRVAYLRLNAAWQQADRLKALAGGLAAGTVPAPQQWRWPPLTAPPSVTMPENPDAIRAKAVAPGSLAWRRWAAMAAAITCVVVGGGAAYFAWFRGTEYQTAIGGQASVPLTDGSHLTLNTHSRLRVVMDDRERRIELDDGEAYFEVAKDASRPFVVRVGDKTVTAVGTKFSVRREDWGVQVIITEGQVRVTQRGLLRDQTLGRLSAGMVGEATEADLRVESRTAEKLDDDLSWRTGTVVFHDTALGDAVTEINRYNPQPIVISDPSLAALRISGRFRASNGEAFVRLLELGFGVSAEQQPDQIVLKAATNRR